MMSINVTIFRELLTMKPHELVITNQIWVVESDWLVDIQLKVTCARLATIDTSKLSIYAYCQLR